MPTKFGHNFSATTYVNGILQFFDRQLLSKRQVMWGEIISNFVASLENLNFKMFENLLPTLHKNKKQIFVPDSFITKNLKMLFTEKEKLEEKLKNPQLSEKEKREWRCRAITTEGEVLERRCYNTLKEYFGHHSDQKILILHGYEVESIEVISFRLHIQV